ncbi:MAG: hypothetical protein V4653_07840 [Pseudomonadota bacterium]
MLGKTGSTPKDSDTWCAGLWDFGKLNNTQTGRQGELQLHGTITKAAAIPGIGFHISAYALGSGGYVLNDWNPANAIARRYYKPTGLATGAYMNKTGAINKMPGTIGQMAALNTMVAETWAYFLTIYPEYKAPVVFHMRSSDFPPLGS